MLYLVKLLYNIESIIGHLRVFVFRFLYIAAKVRKAAGMARLTLPAKRPIHLVIIRL